MDERLKPIPEMEGKITVKVDLKGLDESSYREAIDMAARIIREGGTVAFPTETVYGLGADGLNPLAVEKIFIAKGRPSDNPLILHVADRELSGIVKEVPDNARILMDRFWPGPLTIVMRKTQEVPLRTTGGLDTVGVRMPDNPVALDLIRASGRPIAAPSANISGRPSPTTYGRCIEDLDGRVDMILGWDSSEVGIESTIVDMTEGVPEILRPGAITLEDIHDTIHEVSYHDMGTLSDEEAPRAPGMKYRHYAPEALVRILKGDRKSILDYIDRENLSDESSLFIFFGEEENEKIRVRMENLSRVIVYTGVREGAHSIFEDLRLADDEGIRTIYIEAVKEEGLALGLMNRIKKASGFNITEV